MPEGRMLQATNVFQTNVFDDFITQCHPVLLVIGFAVITRSVSSAARSSHTVCHPTSLVIGSAVITRSVSSFEEGYFFFIKLYR